MSLRQILLASLCCLAATACATKNGSNVDSTNTGNGGSTSSAGGSQGSAATSGNGVGGSSAAGMTMVGGGAGAAGNAGSGGGGAAQSGGTGGTPAGGADAGGAGGSAGGKQPCGVKLPTGAGGAPPPCKIGLAPNPQSTFVYPGCSNGCAAGQVCCALQCFPDACKDFNTPGSGCVSSQAAVACSQAVICIDHESCPEGGVVVP